METTDTNTTTESTKSAQPLCRFYGREREGCDIGVQYLSPSEVETVVRYCSADFTSCNRYKMLAEKWSGAGSKPCSEGSADGAPRPRDFCKRLNCDMAREVMQHELRTPITSILTSAEILKKNPDRPAEVRAKFVNVVYQEAKRLKHTVEALFDGLEAQIAPELDEPRPEITPEPKPLRPTVVQSKPIDISTKRRNTPMQNQSSKRGWVVALAGTGINLALGILYTWSIFKGAIADSVKSGGEFQWDLASINDPYAVCCLVFAFAMIVAGKVQDRFGPMKTAMTGGLLVGAGFIMISLTTNYYMWILGFGVLAGMGIGFGYSAATPPAIKWFPPAKTGMIAGIVVSGFGLASVYIAPLAKYLVGIVGLQYTMFLFGASFAVVVTLLSFLLVNPERPVLGIAASNKKTGTAAASAAKPVEMGPSQILKTFRFYALWAVFFVASGAGLMVIGSVAGMAKQSLGEMAFIAVACMAVGNAGGRLVAGILSDKIGRLTTLLIMLAFQASLMFAGVSIVGSGSTSATVLVLLASFIGFNYGTNLSLFPSLAKDYWGLKNFGINYGILFSSWGVGGFVMGRLSQMLTASTGSYNLSFTVAGLALVAGAVITIGMQVADRKKAVVEVEEPKAAVG